MRISTFRSPRPARQLRTGIVAALVAGSICLTVRSRVCAAELEEPKSAVPMGHVTKVPSSSFDTGHTGNLSALALSRDGKTLVTGGWDGRVKIWDADGPKERATLRKHSRGIRSLAISPDGKRAASAGQDHRAIIYDLLTAQEQQTIILDGRVLSVAFSPDNKSLLTGSGEPSHKGEMKIWDANTAEERMAWRLPREVWGTGFSLDGARVAAACGDQNAYVADVKSGNIILTLKHSSYVRRVAFSRDGRYLVTTFGDDGRVCVWDLGKPDDPKDTLVATFQAHGHTLHSLAFSEDGKRVLTGAEDQAAKLWTFHDGEMKILATFPAHSGTVFATAFGPGGKQILTAGDGPHLKHWDVGSIRTPKTR